MLAPAPGKVYIDGTLGAGGHAERLCQFGARVIAFDRDVAALDRAERRLRPMYDIRFVHADYRYFADALDMLDIAQVDGVLLDLGLSSDQLADEERGFSFDSNGKLDMRFDVSEGSSAKELLQSLPEEKIADMIFQYGEERYSRKIAKRIAEYRRKIWEAQEEPFTSARELAELVRQCIPRSTKSRLAKGRKIHIDPATRTFQALRIAVNDELGALQSTLDQLPSRLKPGGVAAVISFHSLEDRIVKTAFRNKQYWENLTSKPITATEEEIIRNPRARSAKLRGAVNL